MSKQHKPPIKGQASTEANASVDATQASGVEAQHQLGNQAVQGLLDAPTAAAGAADITAARDAALPLLARGVIALQVWPPPTGSTERLVDLVTRSQLPADRRALLTERLEGDLEMAEGIAEAVQRWFGDDNEALRADLIDTLDGAVRTLEAGQASDAGWVRADGTRIDTSAEALAGAPDALIRDLTQADTTAELDVADLGNAIYGYCRDVFLLLRLDEDEEEDQQTPTAPPVELT